MTIHAGQRITSYCKFPPKDRPLFDGGIFTNGGFEDGIVGWSNFSGSGWTATPGEDTAQNIPNTAGNHFYQNERLVAGATYKISADQLSGDGTVTYCINTSDSGIPISDGPTTFIGVSSEESIGVTMSIAGTTPAVIDNLRLTRVDFCAGIDLCLTVGK